MNESMITHSFGNTDRQVTHVGLGGEGVLRTYGQEEMAYKVIEKALSEGITYFDSAPAYSGCESYYGHVWANRPKDRDKIFQTGKSALRYAGEASAELERTLSRLNRDHLDLWQIHDVRTQEDLDMLAGPGGALEAFVKARDQGKTRFIGITGHHDPHILTQAVREWPLDAVLLPVNPVEAGIGGFLDQTLPAALGKGIAVIGMKVLGGAHYLAPQAGVDAQVLIRFALSQPITLAIVGCSNPGEVETLADMGREFQPYSETEMQQLVDLYNPHARRLAYYRGTL